MPPPRPWFTGSVGEPEFSDRAVRDPAVVALRERVTVTVDPSIAEDQVRIAILLKGRPAVGQVCRACDRERQESDV